LQDPLLPLQSVVCLEGQSGLVSHSAPLGCLQLEEPHLYVAPIPSSIGIDTFEELDPLPLTRDHVRDASLDAKDDIVDSLETLTQMGLHGSRVLGLGEDLEELIVREEEEAGKVESLRLEVTSPTADWHLHWRRDPSRWALPPSRPWYDARGRPPRQSDAPLPGSGA
jgi:hypothetical protein